MTISPKIRKCISISLSSLLIIVMAWGIYVVFKTLWSSLNQQNPTVATGIIAAITTILVSVVSVLISKHLEQRNNILKELREKKTPVYEELLEFLFRVMHGEKAGLTPLSEAELIGKFSGITQRLIIWGSDEVVHSLYYFRRSMNNGDKASTYMLIAFEEILLAIRKDLGHHNKKLTHGKILGTFVNDLHQIFKP